MMENETNVERCYKRLLNTWLYSSAEQDFDSNIHVRKEIENLMKEFTAEEVFLASACVKSRIALKDFDF